MNNLHYITTKAWISILFQQMSLQQQLIETQQKVVELQARIDSLTPKNPPQEKAIWHLASGGKLSIDSAKSNNLREVKEFRDWNVRFAEQYIKPYVSPTVFSECVNQMTRGLPERIAELETKREFEVKKPSEKPILQLPLMQNA
jgi:cell division protein FtsL